jgi:DNA-binding protein H-NS
MSDFIRIVTHVRRFKSAVKELSIEQLEETKEKLIKIIEERKTEVEAERKANEDRLQKINKYKEMLAADGIEPDELQEGLALKAGRRGPRKPKYEIWNEAGERITWTGQGRMPNIFKQRVESGEPLETFLID